MLKIQGLNAGYNHKRVLFDISLDVPEGQVVCLIGPNGAGKSTLLKSISGLVEVEAGSIELEHRGLLGKKPYQVSREGVLHVPEGRQIFGLMTVYENLLTGCAAVNDRAKSSDWKDELER